MRLDRIKTNPSAPTAPRSWKRPAEAGLRQQVEALIVKYQPGVTPYLVVKGHRSTKILSLVGIVGGYSLTAYFSGEAVWQLLGIAARTLAQ
jgi:hypothetical protein